MPIADTCLPIILADVLLIQNRWVHSTTNAFNDHHLYPCHATKAEALMACIDTLRNDMDG